MTAMPPDSDVTLQPEHRIVTPEGVTLHFPAVSLGHRLAALMLDLFFLFLLIAALGFGIYIAEQAGWDEEPWILAFGLILFLFRTFYFLITEVAWRGMTPGKRLLSLRVIDRLGGPLTMKALIARNLSREVELFLPLQLFFQPLAEADQWGGTDLLIQAATLVWAVSFTVVPFFNRDRLRLGDLIAGTIVVQQPTQHLLPDITLASDAQAFSFTRAQLEAYGIYELEHLAAALRASKERRAEILPEIAVKIAAKIDWLEPISPAQAEAFLLAYYQALRRHLEQRLLFGKRRLSKHDRA